MNYLIDTNIISEVRKGNRCNPQVATWYASVGDGELFLSTLVLGEIRKGIERARPRDPNKAAVLVDPCDGNAVLVSVIELRDHFAFEQVVEGARFDGAQAASSPCSWPSPSAHPTSGV